MDQRVPSLNEFRNFYYDKKEIRLTPSYKEGMTAAFESMHRKDSARFIIQLGKSMKLGYNTTATAVVYFHRFYMIHSFSTFPRYVTSLSCLFLAGKVEETPKKCEELIKMAEKILPENEFEKFGPDPRDKVLRLEKMILQTIRFNLLVEHPYEFISKYIHYLKGDKHKIQKVLEMAWTFVNDSLCTTLCIQWEPEIVAISMIYLAAKLSKYEIVDWVGKVNGQRWWDMFVQNLTMDLMEDICHQVLDLYSQNESEHKGHHYMAPLKFPGMHERTDNHMTTNTPSPRINYRDGVPNIVNLQRMHSQNNTSMASAAGSSGHSYHVEYKKPPNYKTN